MSAPNDDFYARVVFAGLSRMTEDRSTVQSAFTFWQQKLASRPFNVKEIVAYMERYIGLKTGEKKALFIAMQAASNKLPAELEPVPGYVNGADVAAPAASATPVENTTAHNAVCTSLLQHLALQIKRNDRSAFSELTADLADVGFDDTSRAINQALAVWAQANLSGLRLPKSITVKECQDLFHGMYLLCTELVGPVETDSYVNLAVVEARKLEQAADFDPRNLL